MATADTSTRSAALQIIPISSPNDSVQPPPLEDTELASLQVLICEKDARIEKLTEENQYLHAQIEKLEGPRGVGNHEIGYDD